MNNKNRIYFFQYNFAAGYGEFKTYWLPHAIANIWAYAAQHKDITDEWEAVTFEFLRKDIDTVVDSIKDPTVAAFSWYSWNKNYTIEIARRVKEKYPNCVVIFGGPEVSELTERVEKFYDEYSDFVDYTIHGEGEQTFVNLLRYINHASEIPQGVTHKDNMAVTFGERIDDLSTLASPIPIFDKILADHPTMKISGTLETNRGCPYSCTFCDWGSLTYAKVKKFPVAMVNELIDWYGKVGTSYVIIADANFGIFKDRDLDFLKRIVDAKERTGFPESYGMAWQKNSTTHTVEMIKYLTEHNLARGLTLSVQSMADEVLENIKRKNMEISKFSDVLYLCNSENILTYSEMILGLPGETLESWTTGINTLLEAGQHNQIEFWLCQVLQNAELNSPEYVAEYDIETVYMQEYLNGSSDEVFDNLSEGANVIVSTKSMPRRDLIDSWLYSWMISSFHLHGWTQILSRWNNVVNGISYADFYNELLEFLKTDDIMKVYYDEIYTQMSTLVSDSEDCVTDKSVHSLIPDYQRSLHTNRDVIFDKIKQFVINSPTIVYDKDVMKFNTLFVTDWYNRESHTHVFDTPIWHIINNQSYTNASSYEYAFSLVQEVTSKEMYYDAFYFNRRKGWGKSVVTHAISKGGSDAN